MDEKPSEGPGKELMRYLSDLNEEAIVEINSVEEEDLTKGQ